MMDAALLNKIGFRGEGLECPSVGNLIDDGVLDRPLDGNHGEIHPKASDYVDNGIPFVMATDLRNGRIDLAGCYKIPESIAHGLRKGFAKTGDVILSHKATLGRVARVGEIQHDFIVLTPQTTYYRVLKPDVLHPDYLVQYFRSQYFQDVFSLWGGSGSTRAYLGITAQKKLPIVFPPVDSQRKIAAILTAYDDLIENNRQRIALLEKMAEEIYREWFVRLRFPGHEHTAVHKGVPEGWERLTSSEILHVMSGGTPKTDNASFWDGEIPFFTPKDATDSFFVKHTEKTISESGLESCNSALYPANTIFITARGTVGKIALAQRPMAMNQSCYALAPMSNEDSHYYFLALRGAVSVIRGIAKSGVFSNIIVDTFKQIPLFVPSDDVRKRFGSIIDPIFRQLIVLGDQVEFLGKTRDLLLNRLISGKLRVDDLDIQFPPSMQEEAA